MYPAWLLRGDKIDLAFVVPVFYGAGWIEITKRWTSLEEKNLVGFFSREEVKGMNITSERMRFLIETAFSVI